MTDKEEFSKTEEQIISDALQSSSVKPPELISARIKKAARESLKTTANDKPKKYTFKFWYKPLPLAACVIVGFYAGTKYQDADISSSHTTALQFQGNKPVQDYTQEQEWTEDKLLKEIAEAALAGDIQRAEDLIYLYKKKFSRESR